MQKINDRRKRHNLARGNIVLKDLLKACFFVFSSVFILFTVIDYWL